MKELPLVSFFCSCILPEPREKPTKKTQGTLKASIKVSDLKSFSIVILSLFNLIIVKLVTWIIVDLFVLDVVDLNLCIIKDMEVIELNKRSSGQAFEVILRPPSFDGQREFHPTFPPRRDPSLEEIQKKLDAAEERRKVRNTSWWKIIS